MLNIGSCDDPAGLGTHAAIPLGLELAVTHFDMDKHPFPNFIQGDAHDLRAAGIEDRSYDLVVMADIHEHLYNPMVATLEAARVTALGGALVMTIFEEWRLPKGQHIQEGIALGERHTRAAGYASYDAYMGEMFPDVAIISDTEIPHHFHINMFTDEDVQNLVGAVLQQGGWRLSAFLKVPEQKYEEHVWSNWLIALERVTQ